MTWWAAEDKARQLESKLAELSQPPGDEECHYVVLQNGINGDAGDWLNFVDQMGEDRTVVVIVSRENEGRGKTNDGLAAAGSRLANLIESKVPAGARLSVVGHSMGGLIVRSALLDLNSRGTEVHKRWQLQVFCTFSTPHLGTILAPAFVSMAARKIHFVSVSDILDIRAAAEGDGAAVGKLFSAEERAILGRFNRRVLFGAAPWADDVTVPMFSSLMVTRNTIDTVKEQPNRTVRANELWDLRTPEIEPFLAKGDVREFIASVEWERWAVDIPSPYRFDIFTRCFSPSQLEKTRQWSAYT